MYSILKLQFSMDKNARFLTALLNILKRERHLTSDDSNERILDILCINSHMIPANNSMLDKYSIHKNLHK